MKKKSNNSHFFFILIFCLPSSLQAKVFYISPTGSDVIDNGVDVGLPFSGAAPDLGAYET
jgi:hypothetical protein